MNDRTGNDTRGSSGNGGGDRSRGAAIAGVFRIDGHDGYHGRVGGRDLGSGQSSRMAGNHTGFFRGGVNGGGVRGGIPAHRDVVERDRISSGGKERAGLGVMRVFSWLGARLGCGETTEGAGVMENHAPMIRFVVLAAVMFIGLQWLFADWFASIEARIWFYEHLTGFRR